ncbi:MAG TPA: hypothetical protein PLU66_11560 [Trueperaceae bacterium]|nr:hypothetical protein [Trueperaceae bacterium]
MRPQTRPLWAYLLIGLGVFFLAVNVGWLDWVGDWQWALLCLGGGAASYYYYATHSTEWWALIPGFALAAIGVGILAGDAGGPVFLLLLGAGFAGVYLTRRRLWWAIIPAGTLFTLALVAWLTERSPGLDTGWVFFLGLAVTFALLFFLPDGQGKQRWAVYPALGVLALVALTAFPDVLGEVFLPLLLVLAGIILLWRRGGSSKGPTLPRGSA